MENGTSFPSHTQKRSRADFEAGDAIQVKPNGDSVQDGISVVVEAVSLLV